MSHYTYEQLIDSYFRTIKNKLSNFESENCKKYVLQFKTKFDEEKFFISLTQKLIALDFEISDYDTSDNIEEEK